MEWYSKAIESNRSNIDVWLNRAVAAGHLGNFASALSDLANAEKLNPQDWRVFLDRGVVFLGMAEPDKAMGELDAALKINPGNSLVLTNRARARYEAHKFKEALEDASAALIVSPKNDVALRYKALSLEVVGYTDLSIEAWSSFIHENPRSPEGYWNRARARINARQISGAFADIEQSIQLDPNCWQAYEIRSLANRKVGDFTQSQIDEATARLMGGGESTFE
jgi:tetratricopeptide (TPR) repeat protein